MIRFLILIILSTTKIVTAKSIPLNKPAQINKSSLIYKSVQFNRPECSKLNNCWLFIGEIADSASIRVNGKVITSLTNNKNKYTYSHFNSISIPIPSDLFQAQNQLEIKVNNLNQGRIGIPGPAIKIDSYENIHLKTLFDFLSRTGLTLLSSYTLFVFSFVFLILMFIYFDKVLVELCLYSIICCIYLFSFSEVPRLFADPVILSGPIHFSLRLLQDLLLIRLLAHLYNYNGRYLKYFNVTYLLSLSTILVTYLWGVNQYQHYLSLMFLFAPLVAMPMLFGFIMSFKLTDLKERRTLIPLSFFLMIMQVNDLLVFWDVYSGFFTVKWYLPFVVITLMSLYVRRAILKTSKLKAEEEVFKTSAKIAHDIRAPLHILQSIKVDPKENLENEIFHDSLNRLNEIANQLLEKNKTRSECSKSSISLLSVLSIIKKEVEFIHNIPIELTHKLPQDEVAFNSSELKRVFSNILNNAAEASKNKETITIQVVKKRRYLIIKVIDQGTGISSDILEKLGNEEFSSKNKNGNGLGLYSSFQIVKRFGGKIIINSKPGLGTEVSVYLRRPRRSFYKYFNYSL